MHFYARILNYLYRLYIKKTMKKLTLAAAVLCLVTTFSYCKKEHMLTNYKEKTVSEKLNTALVDFLAEPPIGYKANLGQADGGWN
jgi:hypothetical protein